jgi:hypothetical protein
MLPFARRVVPGSDDFTLDVAIGSPLVSSGGQNPAHCPEQELRFRMSFSNR